MSVAMTKGCALLVAFVVLSGCGENARSESREAQKSAPAEPTADAPLSYEDCLMSPASASVSCDEEFPEDAAALREEAGGGKDEPATEPADLNCDDFTDMDDAEQLEYVESWYESTTGDPGWARRADAYRALEGVCKDGPTLPLDTAIAAVEAELDR
ncbi:MAG: hypothetical protein JWL76_2146 [Thermoleophilia bacterium]|nr:hypothetical protein [Thermoleophilia bacterium]